MLISTQARHIAAAPVGHCSSRLFQGDKGYGTACILAGNNESHEVLEIALLALLVPNFSRLELVTYIVIDSLVLGLELEKN